MSLESTLEALVCALNRNSDVMLDIAKGKYRLQHAPDTTLGEPLTATQEVEKVIAAREEARELPNAQEKSEETPQTILPTSEPTESGSAPVTYQDVKDVTISMSKTDLAKTKAALSRFGVASAKGLKEEQWAEYHAYMLKVQAGDINPEESHG
jgi:hypothetical protein